MTTAQNTISEYLTKPGEVSAHTMLCFVGMLESGEATAADFEACQHGLAPLVAQKREVLDQGRDA